MNTQCVCMCVSNLSLISEVDGFCLIFAKFLQNFCNQPHVKCNSGIILQNFYVYPYCLTLCSLEILHIWLIILLPCKAPFPFHSTISTHFSVQCLIALGTAQIEICHARDDFMGSQKGTYFVKIKVIYLVYWRIRLRSIGEFQY
jgi:hypothetical protein